MSTPTVPVVATDWLGDPVALAVGPKTVALVLILAARALAAHEIVDEPVVISGDVWSYYFDRSETARVVAEGLVEPLTIGGRPVAFRCSTWVLDRVDTDRAIRVRDQTRDRVRRLRERRRDQLKLDLWTATDQDAERVSMSQHGLNTIHGSDGLLKSCGDAVGVTALHVTQPAAEDLSTRTGACAEVRTTTYGALQDPTSSQTKSIPKHRDAICNTERPIGVETTRREFSLLVALVARVRQARWSWSHPTSSTDRQDLLDAVRVAIVRAHLRSPTDREIRRAIRYVDRGHLLSSTRSGDAS